MCELWSSLVDEQDSKSRYNKTQPPTLYQSTKWKLYSVKFHHLISHGHCMKLFCDPFDRDNLHACCSSEVVFKSLREHFFYPVGLWALSIVHRDYTTLTKEISRTMSWILIVMNPEYFAWSQLKILYLTIPYIQL